MIPERQSHDQTCAVCGATTQVQSCSGGLAPVSYLACTPCRERNAKPLGIVLAWLTLEGMGEDLTAFREALISFDGGVYIAWPEIHQVWQDASATLAADLLADESFLIEDEGFRPA